MIAELRDTILCLNASISVANVHAPTSVAEINK